jgi:hypothetical protein
LIPPIEAVASRRLPAASFQGVAIQLSSQFELPRPLPQDAGWQVSMVRIQARMSKQQLDFQ